MPWRCDIIILICKSLLRTLPWIECWLVVEGLGKPKDRKVGSWNSRCWVVECNVYAQQYDRCQSKSCMRAWCLHRGSCSHVFWLWLWFARETASEWSASAFKHWYSHYDLYDSSVAWALVLWTLHAWGWVPVDPAVRSCRFNTQIVIFI